MSKLKIYLVEDSAVIVENLTATLEELAGAEVVGACATAAEAIAALNRPDCAWQLAIVDVFLREGSGLDVLKACSQREPAQKMAVFSNYATADVRRRCIALGADRIFDKSNEVEALVEYCRSIDS